MKKPQRSGELINQNIKRINMEKENLKEIYLAGGCF